MPTAQTRDALSRSYPLAHPLTLPWDGALRAAGARASKAAALLVGRDAGGLTAGAAWWPTLWGSAFRDGKAFDYRAAVGDPLGSSIVVACLNAIAQAVPEPPPRVYRIASDGEDEALPRHPLQSLLRRPNPYMSWELLMGLRRLRYASGGQRLPLEGPQRGGQGGGAVAPAPRPGGAGVARR